MTDRQWDAISTLLDQCWKGEFDEDRADAYRVFLDPYDGEVVLTALHRIAQSGKPWLPAAAEIVAAIERPDPLPTFGEAWDMVTRCLRRFGYDGEAAGLPALGERHPLYERWLSMHGWKRMYLEPVEDAQWGGAVMKRLEDEWNGLIGRIGEQEKTHAALEASTGRRQLGPRSLAGALERLVPTAPALPSGEPPTVPAPDQSEGAR